MCIRDRYKVDPMQLDAVLIYAKSGSGRRAGLYTDYSFALWKDKELIKYASAYSGLTNIEIKELDQWIRKNTIEKFGPVRSLKPEMVFEISFFLPEVYGDLLFLIINPSVLFFRDFSL